MMTKLTPARRKALEILRDYPGIRPQGFAEKMWPDSEGWSHMTNCGRGVTRGGGMPRAAGGFLGKLRKAGLVWNDLRNYNNDYYLTEKGKEVLADPPRCSHGHTMKKHETVNIDSSYWYCEQCIERACLHCNTFHDEEDPLPFD